MIEEQQRIQEAREAMFKDRAVKWQKIWMCLYGLLLNKLC